MVDQWGDKVTGDVKDTGVSLVGELVFDPHVGDGPDVAAAQDLADRALVLREDRQPSGLVIGQPSPGSDLEAVVAQDPDGRHVGPQRPLCLVDDHREELDPIVRGGEPPGDLKDGVKAPGKL
jgi:hypothetical protein